MSQFYANTTKGNGYSCGCCRHEFTSYISSDSREEFIKEFYEDYISTEGDIQLSYLRGITKEEIACLMVNFKEMDKVLSKLNSLEYKHSDAKKHLEGLNKYIEIVNEYPQAKSDIDLEIELLVSLIGKQSIPEDLLGD